MEPLSPDDPSATGRYRLLGRLGRGGMGRVYLGRSAGGRTVAVKVVHPHLAADDRFRSRFAREVASARRVGGAWTAPVLDADPDADLPWVATGYVAGPDLQRAVDEHGPLPEATARALGAGLAEALAAVHASGLVHRDVKPSNVLLALDGPRLIDFGIARASDASAVLTATGVAVGSPGYMSPEQVQGQPTGRAGDVFSYGAVLAFAAGGRQPFPGDSAAQLLYRVVHEEPDLARVPAGPLREVVTACLAKSPDDRPTPEEAARVCADGAGAAALIGPGWLPPPVVEAVSRRAVRLLDAEVTPPGPATPAAANGASANGPGTTGSGTTGSGTTGTGTTGTQRSTSSGAVPVPGDGTGVAAVPSPYASPPPPGFGPPSPGYGCPRAGRDVPTPDLAAPRPGPGALGYGYPPSAAPVPAPPGDAPAGDPPPGRSGRRARVGVVVGALVAVAALLAAGAVLLPGDEDTVEGESGGPSAERSTARTTPPAALPDRYVGRWQGNVTIPPGVDGGTMTFELEAGRIGDRVGAATSTLFLGLTECVDRLTLREVTEERIVLDARVDPDRSDGTVCAQGDFQYVVEPRGENAIHISSTHPDSGSEGVLDRQF